MRSVRGDGALSATLIADRSKNVAYPTLSWHRSSGGRSPSAPADLESLQADPIYPRFECAKCPWTCSVQGKLSPARGAQDRSWP